MSGERRVHIIPSELMARVRSFQSDHGIATEVEAIRRLLDRALQHRETGNDIMAKLKDRFGKERNLRVLAREVIAAHSLVTSMTFRDNEMEFDLADGTRGMIRDDGALFKAAGDGDWEIWNAAP